MKNPRIFSEKIFYYESVIPNVQELVYLTESTNDSLEKDSLVSTWHPWIASGDSYVFGQRKTTDHSGYDAASKSVKEVYDTLNNTLAAYGKDYSERLGIELGTQMPISISKYFTGSSMGAHTDSSAEPTTENVSAVIYLNDNYAGGEINFPKQGIKIKPSAGSIVIFPSVPPFYHESLEVKNGTKYMSPAFWHLLS